MAVKVVETRGRITPSKLEGLLVAGEIGCTLTFMLDGLALSGARTGGRG